MHRATIQDAGSEAWADAMDKVVIALMIEKKEAIENLKAMLAVPGVDMVQFGPADYANSIGLTGQFTHPKVAEAERTMIQTALSMGIAVRVELNDPRGFEPYLQLGVKHFNVGIDVKTLFKWFCESGAIMRRELGLEPLIARENAKSNYGK